MTQPIHVTRSQAKRLERNLKGKGKKEKKMTKVISSQESPLDMVLEAYRDTFGVKTERANEIHRDACIEVAAYRDAIEALNKIIIEITETLIRDGRFPNAVPAILAERAAALKPLGLK